MHFVDEAVDHGAIILQRVVPVLDEDTAESLSARILEQEHIAYAEAIARVLSGDCPSFRTPAMCITPSIK